MNERRGVHFDVERMEACGRWGQLFALPTSMIGRGPVNIRRLEQISFGSWRSSETIRAVPTVSAVIQHLEAGRYRNHAAGLMAVQMVKLCSSPYRHQGEVSGQRKGPVLEHVATYALAGYHHRYIPVKMKGQRLFEADEIEGVGPLEDVAYPQYPQSVWTEFPISHVIDSVPFNDKLQGLVALRDLVTEQVVSYEALTEYRPR